MFKSKEEKTAQMIEKLKKLELQEFTNYMQSPWRIIWANFLAGTARGLGFLIGAAIVIAIVSFIMTKVLANVPIVGEFFQAVNVWIQEAIDGARELKQ